MDVHLRQRGRASIEFAADLGRIAARLSAGTRRQIQQTAPQLAEDLDERLRQVDAALADSAMFRSYRQLGEWMSDSHGRITIDAFEEIRSEIEPEMARLKEGSTTLEANPECEIPDYWQGVEIHRTTGGWDGHQHMGFIHGELIHKRYVAKNYYGGGIFKQRGEVLNELPREDYGDIFEMGTSSGHYTVPLAERFPNAKITGCDLSIPMLEHAQRTGNELGCSWRLIQVPMEHTGLLDQSFDLVTSYIVLHEIPVAATRAMFAEAFRLLRPGGEMLMTDIRPHRDRDALDVWQQEFNAVNGGEPYWREAALLDLAALATELGFVDAKSYGLGEMHYPWVTLATKPER